MTFRLQTRFYTFRVSRSQVLAEVGRFSPVLLLSFLIDIISYCRLCPAFLFVRYFLHFHARSFSVTPQHACSRLFELSKHMLPKKLFESGSFVLKHMSLKEALKIKQRSPLSHVRLFRNEQKQYDKCKKF